MGDVFGISSSDLSAASINAGINLTKSGFDAPEFRKSNSGVDKCNEII
jgi:hypothetical protein